jgi:ribonuclease HI
MNELLSLEFDGGSRGNPGPAGIGVVVRAADGTALVTLGRFIGKATNNVAEYRALITAMEEAKKLGAKKVKIRGDSELVVRQMTGVYRVKHPDLVPLYKEAKELFSSFAAATIEHNYREKNELADKLGNMAMDRRADVTDAAEEASPLDTPAPKATRNGDRFECGQCGCEVEVRTASSVRPHQLKDFVCQCGSKMREV